MCLSITRCLLNVIYHTVVAELCYLVILQVTHHVMASLANHDRSACTNDDVDRLGMHVCVELGMLSYLCRCTGCIILSVRVSDEATDVNMPVGYIRHTI
jgi:hypothetical protein